MKLNRTILFLIAWTGWIHVASQPAAGYYDNVLNLSGKELQQALHSSSATTGLFLTTAFIIVSPGPMSETIPLFGICIPTHPEENLYTCMFMEKVGNAGITTVKPIVTTGNILFLKAGLRILRR